MERACSADPTSHVKAESFETSRPASSIKDETSMIGLFDKAELSSRILRDSLCLGNSENIFPAGFLLSIMQSRM